MPPPILSTFMVVADAIASPTWPPFAALGVAAAGLLVWGYLNYFAGLTKSLQHRLPQPSETDEAFHQSAPTSDTSHHTSNINPEVGLPSVAFIVPGRDEGDHLPQSLPDLCRQDYPGPLRVIFVDDASTDATPAICRAALRQFPDRLTVVRNDVEPPPGWVGKCWAIHRGVRQLITHLEDGDEPTPWLCFTDADLRWHPDLLRTAMRHAREHDADVLTVCPTLTFGTGWEAIVQLQLMLALGIVIPFHKAMDPQKKDVALTAGAFILVKRDWYDRVGGHEAVKGEVVEDLQIGRRLKRDGAKMRAALAGKLQWCRMYHGAADQWEGLTKNVYAGLDYSPLKAFALLVATLLLNIAPMPLALGTLVWLLLSPSWISAAAFGCALLTTLLQARALNATRKLAGWQTPNDTPPEKPLPWVYAWTMPLGNAAYSVIVIASMWQAYTRGNKWKGRRYAIMTLDHPR